MNATGHGRVMSNVSLDRFQVMHMFQPPQHHFSDSTIMIRGLPTELCVKNSGTTSPSITSILRQ